MRVGVVLKAVVRVLTVRLFGRELFKPPLIVAVKSAFIVVDKDGSGYIHGVNQHKTFLYAAFVYRFLNVLGDAHDLSARRDIEPKFFSVAFHISTLRLKQSAVVAPVVYLAEFDITAFAVYLRDLVQNSADLGGQLVIRAAC